MRRFLRLLPPNFYNNFKIRPRKACKYPNLRSFGWVSYDKVGVLYSGKSGSRSEARASDLRSYPGLWWKRIKLHIYEGTEVSTLRRPAHFNWQTCRGHSVSPTLNLTCGVDGRTEKKWTIIPH